MADTETTTRDSAFLQHALSTLGSGPEWDKALIAYVAAFAKASADYEFGDFRHAIEKYQDGNNALEKACGREYRSTKEGAAVADLLYDEYQKAERQRDTQFLAPLWAAARALVQVPAPSIAAAVFKAVLVQHEDLDNDTMMDKPPITFVAADLAQYAGEAA